ncbi:hypothetical protein OS493_037866 [Desmophyllum pertusum]|uniref:Uncharacterized protein n=1 Tax=Desmophyllum pertusum TaxID=174260 RepID=A0A9W9Z6M8_9CNID|nr:hypothetical protein OS493_037866 [Desmophyllum pertusum]
MMNEDSEMTPELSNSVHQRIRQIVKQNPSLVDKHIAELETILTTLATLPFKDEIQQVTLLEHVQRLQGKPHHSDFQLWRVSSSQIFGRIFNRISRRMFLEEVKRNGSEVSLPNNKERLDIFFNHLNDFGNHRNLTATSLKILAAMSITNEVLREILDQFLYKEKVAIDLREEAFELVFKVLSLHPDGALVKKILKFWRETISDDPGYQTLACLLGLFVEGSSNETFCSQERAERILDFLEAIPRPLLSLISSWQFLWWFVTEIFPTTFYKRRQEILAFINKAVAARVPVEQGQACVNRQTLQFLQWVCQQSCPEETKSEMICLLVCSSGEAESLNWMFAIDNVIKSLGLCQRLAFSTKKHIVRQLTYLAPFIKERENIVLTNFVENIASNQTLEFMDEILCEFLDFIECFVDHQRPKTIPEDILTLLSLLSRVLISVERKRKLMQLSKKSEEGLQSSLRILQLIQKYRGVLQERTNEYFDILFAAIVETLKEDKNLCEQLCNQHPCNFPSIDVLMVWTVAVAGLLSLGLFKEEIDSRCCCPVLQQAYGFSPFETLQLLFQVRTTAVKLSHLSRRQIEANSSSNALHTSQESSIGETDLLKKFVESMTMILFTPALSSWDRLLLVKKVCDVVLSTPNIVTTANFRNALEHYIPWNQSISSNNEGIHLEFYRIVDLLDNPKVLKQLSRMPLDGMFLSNSLCSVLSTKISNSFSSVNVVDIFLFIGSLQDLDQAFFDQLLPFVKVAIQVSTSGEDVLELLKELVHVVRNIRSEMIPLTMLNFAYFIENPVNKQERDKFLNEVAMRWELSPSRRVFSFLEVPRLLWKAYNTASTPTKRGELIDRVQEILKKRNKVRENRVMGNYTYIRRRIACCELEWLVLHSSLSNKAAALAFDLSLFFQPFQHLRCWTVSDVQIEDGFFKFSPQENETASDLPDRGTRPASYIAVGSVSLVKEPQKPILTPVLMAHEVIHHLTRVLEQEEDPSENAFLLWELVCSPQKPFRCKFGCVSNFFDDYVNVFLSILAEASSIEMMFHWARLDKHHVCQCSEVIMKSCKCDEDDIDKVALLKLQTGVSITLEKMRLIKPSLPWEKSYTAPCFRSLKAELKHLGDMLESRLPIEVTMKVLDLYQINIQAGIAVGEIVSLWSCKQEALALVENLQSFCERNQGSPSILKAAQSEFVWKLLKAFGRFARIRVKIFFPGLRNCLFCTTQKIHVDSTVCPNGGRK